MTLSTLFITCPRGLENILVTELLAQGCVHVKAVEGGVACQGSKEQIYRINLHSRVASRVLLRLGQFRYRSEKDIFQAAKRIAWHRYFQVQQTFKVKVEAKRAKVKSLDFVALTIKDAVCDVFREQFACRPSVDKRLPDVRIHAFIGEHEAEIFLDTSGEALFKRGYRQYSAEAPLRENLAAGLLLAAGYDGTQALQDPFCGSGTIVIEAAWIATKRAAGLMRSFGFERLLGFDAQLWNHLKNEAQQQILPKPMAKIVASDIDKQMINMAKKHAEIAKVANQIEFTVQDVLHARPPAPSGLLLSNPPYGIRLEQQQMLHALYPKLGSWLKQYYANWLVALFTADRTMPKLMRLQPKRKLPLFNANLDCRLFLLPMVAGSHRSVSKQQK